MSCISLGVIHRYKQVPRLERLWVAILLCVGVSTHFNLISRRLPSSNTSHLCHGREGWGCWQGARRRRSSTALAGFAGYRYGDAIRISGVELSRHSWLGEDRRAEGDGGGATSGGVGGGCRVLRWRDGRGGGGVLGPYTNLLSRDVMDRGLWEKDRESRS